MTRRVDMLCDLSPADEGRMITLWPDGDHVYGRLDSFAWPAGWDWITVLINGRQYVCRPTDRAALGFVQDERVTEARKHEDAMGEVFLLALLAMVGIALALAWRFGGMR